MLLCCGLFSLCCANFVVLWFNCFRCVVACFHCIVLISVVLRLVSVVFCRFCCVVLYGAVQLIACNSHAHLVIKAVP